MTWFIRVCVCVCIAVYDIPEHKLCLTAYFGNFREEFPWEMQDFSSLTGNCVLLNCAFTCQRPEVCAFAMQGVRAALYLSVMSFWLTPCGNGRYLRRGVLRSLTKWNCPFSAIILTQRQWVTSKRWERISTTSLRIQIYREGPARMYVCSHASFQFRGQPFLHCSIDSIS